MARDPLTAEALMDMMLDRLAELDRSIALTTDPVELVRLMNQRADAIDIMNALVRCR